MKSCLVPFRGFLSRLLPVMALGLAGAAVIAQPAPPARLAGLTHIEGSVAFAPAGATEWSDASARRPLARGDRLWTDKGGRAEVQMGPAALHLDSETFVEVVALERNVLQASLNEGTVNARVRQREGGEVFEITTPQLAFRAAQPGDYRIDVDPTQGTTRVVVRSGTAMLYGAASGTMQLQAGQQMAFGGRDLKVAGHRVGRDSGFDQWAADRNRIEDQSMAARHAPQAAMGHQSGTSRAMPNWVPNQHGHWEWIAPWGWTWVQPRMTAPPAVIVQPHYPPPGWRFN
ncbi:FecR domain-containing protein [Caenimonas soli]|uniref:FecR domain-containing protein n=1 Tax=Caenimonas soli TaxID=2735555 RepID=UPI0015543744|nr:FecR domain-containing protein [Caenimonas soli]NPC58865.1 hypothetical protein [Caenimonas soli]